MLLRKISKMNIPVAKLTKNKKENTHINKIRNRKETLQQIPMKFRISLENILKNYIVINWKM
jgi:hypothetical protein